MAHIRRVMPVISGLSFRGVELARQRGICCSQARSRFLVAKAARNDIACYFGGCVISIAQIAAGRMYIEAR